MANGATSAEAIAASGESKVSAELIARLPALEIISVMGVGYDGIDVAAAKARGDALGTLAPFDPVPVRALSLNGENLDPSAFKPDLPKADLRLTLALRIDGKSNLKGSVNLENRGLVGTIDKQLLPLRAIHGDLGGTLSADSYLRKGSAGAVREAARGGLNPAFAFP